MIEQFGTDLPPALVDSLRKITNVRPALDTPAVDRRCVRWE
jgi:hypothetical protein